MSEESVPGAVLYGKALVERDIRNELVWKIAEVTADLASLQERLDAGSPDSNTTASFTGERKALEARLSALENALVLFDIPSRKLSWADDFMTALRSRMVSHQWGGDFIIPVRVLPNGDMVIRCIGGSGL